MKKIRIIASAALVGLALSACAQDASDTAGNDPGGPSMSSSAQPSPVDPTLPGTEPVLPSAAPTKPGRPGAPTPSAGSLTLTGVITAGVEPGCLLLDDYLLIGGPKDVLQAGARVAVSGRPEPDMMTTCQQGTPFIVETAKAS